MEQQQDINKTRALEIFEKDRFIRHSGLYLVELNESHAVCAAKLSDIHLNGNDVAQGGMLYTLADYAYSIYANYLHFGTVTQSASITYLAPAKDTVHIYAEATETVRKRHNSIGQVLITDDDHNILCVAMFSGFVKGTNS